MGELVGGEFNFEDDGEMVLFDFVNEIGDGGAAGFGLFGTAGEGGGIGEVVFVYEVTEGETVGKDEMFVFGGNDEGADGLVDGGELVGIGTGIGGEVGGVFGGDGGEFFGDGI